MALESGHVGPAGVTDQWLLTCNSAQENRLPGKLLLPEGREWLNVSRVILLLPDAPLDASRVADMFDALHLPRKTQVVLAELAGQRKEQPRRRQLQLLVGRMQQIHPDTRGERLYEPDWLAAMQAFAGRYDLLIATAGQQIGPALVDAVNLPVLEVAGIFPPWQTQVTGWLRRGVFNLFPFFVVAGFFWLQTQIGSQTQGWVASFSIGMTIIFEFAIVFIWSLFLD